VTQVFSARTDVLLASARRYRAQPGATRTTTGVVVLTCMDARFNIYALLGLNEGDAHILRNAGGVVTDDVIRSLTVSQRLFGTTDVMVVMHAGCGLRAVTDDQFAAAVHPDVRAEARRGVARLRNTPFLCPTNDIRGFCFDENTGELHEIC
jgi:carbonic anhydrase